ncbi:MAG: glycosyltransferase [Candidatus Blackburnbacteria bacterium]|nr:glycosyltransferase [Candidatus Blackburnbacteria bacterium]
MQNPVILSAKVPKTLLVINFLVGVFYILWWFSFQQVGSWVLYLLLLAGEIYHLIVAFLFWFTLWPKEIERLGPDPLYKPSVDIYITVCGEPVDVVEKTAIAARDLNYENHKVYLLNDGKVANKDNWQEIALLAANLGIRCITRDVPGGAKAGNINNALKNTFGEIIVIFDADMVPHEDFLEKTIYHFKKQQVGFVQTPQYYQNFAKNDVSGGAWEQQELFFGPILAGKEKSNAVFICGTNVAIRRNALLSAGGMCETNIAEDFITSLLIHEKGWVSVYVPEVLAEGLAPEDLLSYFKQQLRWARGSLEVLFRFNPIFKNLSLSQKFQYLGSALYYLNGLIIAIDALAPLIFFFTGVSPVTSATTLFALFFIPFMLLNLFTLYLASGNRVTFRALAFSQASFALQLQALASIITNQKMGFSVTPKKALEGNFLSIVYPHLAYIGIAMLGFGFALHREGLTPSVVTNLAWVMFNVFLLLPFISVAYPWEKIFTNAKLSFPRIRASN